MSYPLPPEKRQALEAVVRDLAPDVRKNIERRRVRVRSAKDTSLLMLRDTVSQALVTVLGAGVLYLIAVSAGALKGTLAITILFVVIMGASVLGAISSLLPLLRRKESRYQGARLELAADDVVRKLESGEALDDYDLCWCRTGGYP